MGKITVEPLAKAFNWNDYIPIDVFVLRPLKSKLTDDITSLVKEAPKKRYQKLSERDAMKFLADVESKRIEIKEWHGEAGKIYVDAFAINI